MTKSELIDALAARRTDLTKARAELVVNCVFDAMTEALQRGEGIEIRGFGSFTVRPYKPYSGRNPRTGEPVDVPPSACPSSRSARSSRRSSTTAGTCPSPAAKTTTTETVELSAWSAEQIALLERGVVDFHVRAELEAAPAKSRARAASPCA